MIRDCHVHLRSRRLWRLAAVPAIVAMLLTALSDRTPSARLASSQTAPALQYSFGTETWEATWSYNPYAASYDGGPVPTFVLLPLGFQVEGSAASYKYFLASKFTVHGQDVTVQLRRNAKWQTGQPVTSKDLLVTFLIGALEGSGSGIWPFVTSVSTPTSTSMKLVVKGGDSPVTFLQQQVIPTYPVPAFEYQHLLPNRGADLKSLVQEAIAENQVSAPGVPTAHAKQVAKTLTPAFKTVADYNPKTAIGDGPYRLVSQTTFAAELKKSPTFYDYKKIHVPTISYLNDTSLGTGVAQFEHQELDFAEMSFANLLQAKQLKSSGVHLVPIGISLGWNLFFNEFKTPFQNVKVRQAIAYASDIPALSTAGVGRVNGLNPSVWWPSQQYIDGLSNLDNNRYLTSSSKKAMSTYAYSRSKATSLLESAGFHKKNGTWFTPSGTKFSFTITLEANYNDLPGLHLASVLKSFGLDVKAVELPEPELISTIQNGNFNGLCYLWGQLNDNPLSSIEESVTTVGAPAPADDVFNVPGIGKVNLAKEATAEATTIGPGSKQRRLVNAWARFLNREMFFITYAGGNLPYEYSTAHYGDWPPASNKAWHLGNQNGILAAMIDEGYIRPR